MEGLRTFELLLSASGILVNALVETPKFIAIRRVLDSLVFRMVTESIVFGYHA